MVEFRLTPFYLTSYIIHEFWHKTCLYFSLTSMGIHTVHELHQGR